MEMNDSDKNEHMRRFLRNLGYSEDQIYAIERGQYGQVPAACIEEDMTIVGLQQELQECQAAK